MAEKSEGHQPEASQPSSSRNPSSSQNLASTSAAQDSPLDAPLACPRCKKVFKYEVVWQRHIDGPPGTCVQRQVRISRAPPSKTVKNSKTDQEGALHLVLSRHKKETFLPDHIPKATRQQVARALLATLRGVMERNDTAAWSNLLLFCFSTLGSPRSAKVQRKESLPKLIRRNLNSAFLLTTQPPTATHVMKRPTKSLIKNVGKKLQDGDISGAVRVLISNETVLPFDETTIEALREEHPEGSPVTLPVMDGRQHTPRVTEDQVKDAINGFPNGPAGGPDGMRPQYLKELMRSMRGVEREEFRDQLAKVADVMLEGSVAEDILPSLYGANLFAFRKKDGGVRPIAVGLTLRRMVSRIVNRRCQPQGDRFRPQQLGFATPGGVEAGVHAARFYVEKNRSSPRAKILLKLDVKNAFNSLDRTSLLRAVARRIPAYPLYVQQMYSAPSHLLAGGEVLVSSRGVQQGDPFGPLGCCLGTEDAHEDVPSELKESYFDDDLLGGEPEPGAKSRPVHGS